jgi:translation elongation factor EF-Tu-like GTPase
LELRPREGNDFEVMAHIEARIHFLSTAAGGRTHPVATGYRPQFYYENNEGDAVHEYIGKEWVQPGESVTARLRFVVPELHIHKLHMGMPFLIREGSRTVAYGVVTGILGPDTPTAASADHHS